MAESGETLIERKLAAILSADVAGYSRLMSTDETATLTELTELRAVTDELIGQRNGRIASTAGDSVLAEFPTVIEAVDCAVQIQQALAARNADVPEERQMLLRIGVHVGDVMVRDGDIFGDGVNVAARLQALANPGSICISRVARDHLRDRSPFVFEDRGEQALKNIARPLRVFEVRFEGAPSGAERRDDDASDDDAPLPTQEADQIVANETELVFWKSIQDSKEATDYAAYLERYPEGAFATLARARADTISTAPPVLDAEAVSVELTFWDSIKESTDPAVIRSYLEAYPEGHFKAIAAIRLTQITGR